MEYLQSTDGGLSPPIYGHVKLTALLVALGHDSDLYDEVLRLYYLRYPVRLADYNVFAFILGAPASVIQKFRHLNIDWAYSRL